MGKFWLTIILLILAGMGGGVLYLLSVDIEPPREKIEKTLADDRFPQ